MDAEDINRVNKSYYHSLYSILDFDWLIYLQITACKYRSAANTDLNYWIKHPFEFSDPILKPEYL